MILSGGCQCGAIRFRLDGEPRQSSICHCRMCQKAFGNFFAPLVSVDPREFTYTRGAPKHFRSSNYGSRGFCGDCGTPLTYEAPDGLSVAIGAFDHPSLLPPTIQFGIEAKIGYVDHLRELPARETMDDLEDAPFLTDLVSFQHPDEDTDRWQSRGHMDEDHWRPGEEGV